jgi:AcrR family transcriptional regulator
MTLVEASPALSAEQRVLDAARTCCERWGMAKTTIDDIAAEAGLSRATLYRLFPGGRDVLFETLRQQQTDHFFEELADHIAVATSYEDVLARVIAEATQQMRHDNHLQLMLASRPGEVLASLTIDGLPVIIEGATAVLGPLVAPYIGAERSAELAEWLTRMVLSYFFAPSGRVDLGDPDSALRFVRQFVVPAFPPEHPSKGEPHVRN